MFVSLQGRCHVSAASRETAKRAMDLGEIYQQACIAGSEKEAAKSNACKSFKLMPATMLRSASQVDFIEIQSTFRKEKEAQPSLWPEAWQRTGATKPALLIL